MITNKTKDTVRKIFAEYLEKNGHRKTPERFAILDEIYSHDGHFDIESLYVLMKDNNYRVSRATLYNSIGLLMNCGLVVKHQFGRNTGQFEKAYQCSQHDHLVDIESGEVIEFCDPRIEEIIRTACNLHNFVPSYHSLNIYGSVKEPKSNE
jgi:Fur family ferric uptake transcriptional regulator